MMKLKILSFLFLVFGFGQTLSAQIVACNLMPNSCQSYPCGVICNPEICNGSSQGGTLWQTNIPGWGSAHGSPDSYVFGAKYPFTGGQKEISGWSHGAASTVLGETWVGSADVVADQDYLFSFWYRVTPKPNVGTTYLGAVKSHLVYDGTVGAGDVMPNNFQTVFEAYNLGFNVDTFYQAVTCFRASQNFDRIWFYPLQDLGEEQASLRITQVEMVPLKFDLGPDRWVPAGASVTLGDPSYCSVFGAEWEWTTLNDTTVIGNSSSLTLNIYQPTTFILTRTLPMAHSQYDYESGASSCEFSDTITVIPDGKVNIDEGLMGQGELRFPGYIEADGPGFGVLGNGDELIGEEFYLGVYDLQGKQLFSSREWTERWHGLTDQGAIAGGIYLWVCRYRDLESRLRVRRGKVLLVR